MNLSEEAIEKNSPDAPCRDDNAVCAPPQSRAPIASPANVVNLSETQRDEIVEVLERGLRAKDAAAWAGVSVAQIKDELTRDAAFAKRFHRARFGIKLRHLDNIHHIREGNGWRVSAWYLAGAYPKEFGRPRGARRDGFDGSGGGGGTSRRAAEREASERAAEQTFIHYFHGAERNFQQFERVTMGPCVYDPGGPVHRTRPTDDGDAQDPLGEVFDAYDGDRDETLAAVAAPVAPDALARDDANDNEPGDVDDAGDVGKGGDAERAAVVWDGDDVCDELPPPDLPHYAGPTPAPADLPVPERVHGKLCPPPNCLVVNGKVLEDSPDDALATIFADYDDHLYRWVSIEAGVQSVEKMQRYPVLRMGAYFEGHSGGIRRVGRRELFKRFGTLNVQRYVWTGVTYEQTFPVRSSAWDPDESGGSDGPDGPDDVSHDEPP